MAIKFYHEIFFMKLPPHESPSLAILWFNISQFLIVSPSSANFTKWSNKLKEFVGKLPTNCLSVFDHFVGLVLKGLRKRHKINYKYKKYKYPNLLLIRICELKSEKLSHSQRAFSRFLRRIPHKLFCINYSV